MARSATCPHGEAPACLLLPAHKRERGGGSRNFEIAERHASDNGGVGMATRVSDQLWSTGKSLEKANSQAAESKERILNLESIVEELKKERGRLDRGIAALEESASPGVARKTTVPAP